MRSLSFIATLLITVSVQGLSPGSTQEIDVDTAVINKQTQEAYLMARRDPVIAIRDARTALSESSKIGYKKGMADASLAIGMAYFARYNPGDSASYYNYQALKLYDETGDLAGKARAYYCLSYVYSLKGMIDESERYSRLSLENFEKAGDKQGVLNSLSALTYLARQKNDFEGALVLTNRAIETARSVNDTAPLADALNTLGNLYKDMLLFNEAIDSYFDALELWELKKDTNGLAIAYGSIALMYFYQEEYDKALEFNQKKLPISARSGDLWEQSKTLNNIAQIYTAKSLHDSSLYYLRKSLLLNEKMNYPAGMAGAYHNIASTFSLKGEADSAFHYISMSIKLAEKNNDPGLATYLITLGRVQRRMRKYNDALDNALKAYNMAGEQNDAITTASAAGLLSAIYGETGRKDLAYDYLREYHALNDSISNNEFLKKVTRLEIQNEYDRKQEAAEFEHMQEILMRENKIKQQNLYVKGLILLIILLLVISLFYIRNTRLRARYKRIDLEQRLLRAQMNPHFIFNSLCAIQDLILAGQPEKANTFLVKIASLMRNILENSREEFIPLEKELETLKLYLDVQKLRFESGFEYEFTVDSSIDSENISVPPMLAQPCLENSVEHGLMKKKDGGKVEISYKLVDGFMKLEVTDNGVGRAMAAESQDRKIKKKSISTEVVRSRLDYFRKVMKSRNISYDIKDLFENSKPAGTRVVIVMPVKKVFA
ncbi:MAG TPA: tetratricopeptide repeat protein [Bacteroidetes bacterium]|nr:tetratricopeptide repeat protein [Bacteroidota bacterium]